MIPRQREDSDDSLDELFEDINSQQSQESLYTLILKKNEMVFAVKDISKCRFYELLSECDYRPDIDKLGTGSNISTSSETSVSGFNISAVNDVRELFSSDSEESTNGSFETDINKKLLENCENVLCTESVVTGTTTENTQASNLPMDNTDKIKSGPESSRNTTTDKSIDDVQFGKMFTYRCPKTDSNNRANGGIQNARSAANNINNVSYLEDAKIKQLFDDSSSEEDNLIVNQKEDKEQLFCTKRKDRFTKKIGFSTVNDFTQKSSKIKNVKLLDKADKQKTMSSNDLTMNSVNEDGELTIDMESDGEEKAIDGVDITYRKKKIKSFVESDGSSDEVDNSSKVDVNHPLHNDNKINHDLPLPSDVDDKEEGEISSDDDDDNDDNEMDMEDALNETGYTENSLLSVNQYNRKWEVKDEKCFVHMSKDETMCESLTPKEMPWNFSLVDAVSKLPEDFILQADECLITKPNAEEKRKRPRKKRKNILKRRADLRKKLGQVVKNKEPVYEKTPSKEIPCKYYLGNRCMKGAACPFYHPPDRARRLEACKFYKIGYCSKGDDCIYMHSDFPCKFYHAYNKCLDNACRFSHAPLTEETKQLLDKDIALALEPPEAEKNGTNEDVEEGENEPKEVSEEKEVDLFPSLYREIAP